MELSLIIDLALVALIVIFAIVGLIKGFFKSFLSFFGTVVSLIISILLAKKVADALLQVGFINGFFGSGGRVSGWIAGGLNKLSPGFFGTVFSGGGTKDELSAALAGAGIPAFLAPILAGVVSQFNFSSSSLTLAQILSPMIANIIWLIVVTLVLFAILKIILALLNKLFKFLTKNKAISGLNRLFGFIVGALKGVIFVAFVLIVAALFPHAKFLAPFNEALDKTAIAKPFNSIVYDYVGKNIDLEKIMGDLMPGAKKMTVREKTLYAALNTDFAASGLTPENFEPAGEDAQNAIKHFADYNKTLLPKIGGNGLSDSVMEGHISAANSINAKLQAALSELSELKALDPATEQPEIDAKIDTIETLFKEIDALYAQFNGLAAYTMLF